MLLGKISPCGQFGNTWNYCGSREKKKMRSLPWNMGIKNNSQDGKPRWFISSLVAWKSGPNLRSAKVIHVIVIATLITLLPWYFICFASEQQTFDYESLTFTYIASLIAGAGFGLGFSALVPLHASGAQISPSGTFSDVFLSFTRCLFRRWKVVLCYGHRFPGHRCRYLS